MKAVVDEFIQMKNKVGEKITPIYLYAIQYDKLANHWLRFAGTSQDINFDGYLYKKYPIRHSGIKENLSGKIESLSIEISNINREMQYYLDTYGGLKGCEVVIKLVWLENIDNPLCFLEDTYYIEDTHSTPDTISLSMGSAFDVLDIRIPRKSFFRSYCRFRFKADECGYTGPADFCNKTMTRCRELNNIHRFGGFPGIPLSRIAI